MMLVTKKMSNVPMMMTTATTKTIQKRMREDATKAKSLRDAPRVHLVVVIIIIRNDDDITMMILTAPVFYSWSVVVGGGRLFIKEEEETPVF